MNKMLLSTVKVAALFTAATFFAYMILKTQIKKTSEKPNSFSSSKSAPVDMEQEDITEPVLTTVASTKADTVDIDISDEGLDLIDGDIQSVYLESSKVAPIDLKDLVVQKEPFKSPQQIIEEGKKNKGKHFFHSSKAPITPLAVEEPADKGKVPTFIPSSKSKPIVFNDPEKSLEEDRKMRILEEEKRLVQKIAKIEEILKHLKSKLSKLRNTK